MPPPGLFRGYAFGAESAPNFLGAFVIADVPAYFWKDGCGPTAAGMVLGYWDGQGFPGLVVGEAAGQTPFVDRMIASPGHFSDYSLPLDFPPAPLARDKSELPPGDEHRNDSVADWMFTSQSAWGNFYGWSWFSHVQQGLSGYAHAMKYRASCTSVVWGALTWDTFRAEMDAGRPCVFLVDSTGDGGTDHFVTVIGYSEFVTGEKFYACYNTWDQAVHWFDFAMIQPGRPWGVYGACFVRMLQAGDLNNDGVVDKADLALLIAAIRSRSNESDYDLNGDQRVDIADARFLALQLTGQ